MHIFPDGAIQNVTLSISFDFFKTDQGQLYEEMELFEHFFAKQPHETIRCAQNDQILYIQKLIAF